MNEAARHSRRQGSSSGPVAAGKSQGATAVGTGTSIDSQEAASPSEGVGQLLIPLPLHRQIKSAAALSGKNLKQFTNEDIVPKLRELIGLPAGA